MVHVKYSHSNELYDIYQITDNSGIRYERYPRNSGYTEEIISELLNG